MGLALLGIEFDDKLFVDIGRQFLTLRYRLEHAFHFRGVHLHPIRKTVLLGNGQRILNPGLLLCLLAYPNDVAGADHIRRYVDCCSVDNDGLVAHQLSGFGTRCAKSHSKHDVIKPALEELEQVLACRALPLSGLLIIVTKLPLKHAIDTAQLLLLSKL